MPKKRILPTFPKIATIPTWYSLNQATGGLPRGLIELSGYPTTGKSSLANGLAALTAGKNKAVFCELEDFDPEYIYRCIESVNPACVPVIISPIGKGGIPRKHEDMIDEFVQEFSDPKTMAGVIDSLGAVMPVAQLEGSVGDANMGQAPRIIKNMIFKLRAISMAKPEANAIFMTNHVHSIMGKQGTITSGGMAPQYMTIARIRLSRNQDELPNNAISIQGRIDRLKFKPPTELAQGFSAMILPKTHGLHLGLTAVLDCISYELAVKEQGIVKMGGKSFGRLSTMIEHPGEPARFAPFLKALEKLK